MGEKYGGGKEFEYSSAAYDFSKATEDPTLDIPEGALGVLSFSVKKTAGYVADCIAVWYGHIISLRIIRGSRSTSDLVNLSCEHTLKLSDVYKELVDYFETIVNRQPIINPRFRVTDDQS